MEIVKTRYAKTHKPLKHVYGWPKQSQLQFFLKSKTHESGKRGRGSSIKKKAQCVNIKATKELKSNFKIEILEVKESLQTFLPTTLIQ